VNKNLLNKIALVVGGVCIGSGTTYLLVKNRLVAKYDTILAEEIRSIRNAATADVIEAKETMKLLHKQPPYDDPRTAVKAYGERLDELQYMFDNGVDRADDEEMPIHDQLVEDKVLEATEADLKKLDDFKKSQAFVDQLVTGATEAVKHETYPPSQAQRILTLEDVTSSPDELPAENIFELYPKDSIPAESLRDKDYPYLLAEKEFEDNLEDYEQFTLLYYADNVLADEQGVVIEAGKQLLGEDALKQFGYDKENPNTLFVRNDKRKAEYQVIRLDGTHGELVLGITPED